MGNFDRGNDRGSNRGGGRSFGGPRRDFGGGGRSYGSDRPRPSFGGRGGGFGRDGGDRTMFKTVCSNCGKDCEVPFRPTTGKPVYCSDCFEKMGGRESSPRPERSEFRVPTPSFDNNKAQFEAINAKIDRILKLLETSVKEETVKEAIADAIAEEVKTPKVKKVAKKATSKK